MIYDAVIVGGGAAGLTTAAFLAQSGCSTLLLEKESQCGGLVNSFVRDGFTFDGGVRALENAGVLFPMLRQLGIEIEFIKNHISVGIEDKIIHVQSEERFNDYQNMLIELYPESEAEIIQIINDIKQITKFMDIQYGIDNPLFLDIKKDRIYFIKEVFPWMFKYAFTAPKVTSKNKPVLPYLKQFTQNQALLDIISQHFFVDTPAYFALSYFTLYQDYYYPKGGTGTFIQKLVEFIEQNGGEIQTGTEVVSLNLDEKQLKIADGKTVEYRQLCWAADQKRLYDVIDVGQLHDLKLVSAVKEKRDQLADLTGNESVLTLYLTTSLPPDYFKAKSTGHFFYTPSHEGITKAGEMPIKGSWEQIKDWLEGYLKYTTYEIAIPVLRDASLAPEGKTGLIISVLFDYNLTQYIFENGWGQLFNAFVTSQMIEIIEGCIYPGLSDKVLDSFTATPVTLQKITGNTQGAITGWSFTNEVMPSVNRLVKIASAVKTPLPDITQAGQWTYSPSGFPVALITGKLAADRVNKQLK
jgi:phytoene dehydrogenase-like protein